MTEQDSTTTTTAEPQAPAGSDAATQTAAPSSPSAPTELPDWAKDPAVAFKMVNDLRAENGRDRTAAKEAAKAEAKAEIFASLGLQPKAEVAPEVAQQIAERDNRIRDLSVRTALTDALVGAGAKPIARAAILGDGVLNGLDPASATFDSDVAAKVTDYLTKNPDLKAVAAPVAPRSSGGDGTGGSTAKPTYTRAQLRNFDFYQANKADIDLAAGEGRITD